MASLRPRRSALFMPAANPRTIAKARGLACDVVILDLEDAVASEAKADARAQAIAAAAEGFGGRETVLRINAAGTEWHVDDLAGAASARFDAVLLPKAGSVGEIAAVRAALGANGPAVWAMIESARGLLALPALADAARDLRLEALVAGTNDLALDLRARPGSDRAALLPHLAAIVAAARASGMVPLDGVLNAIDDPDRLAAECVQGRDFGFDGKTLIHPAQIDTANRLFGPSAEECDWAVRVIAAFADPAAAGRGAIQLDGAMVERLHLAEAERIVALAGMPASATTELSSGGSVTSPPVR